MTSNQDVFMRSKMRNTCNKMISTANPGQPGQQEWQHSDFTSDGANITIHPQHDGLTIDQLWQRTRDEMQRNAEEKVRIKNNMKIR